MSDQLRKQTVRSMGLLAMGTGAGKAISFATTLILARLLAPEDYGLMALAMVFVGLISFFNDVGLGAAIVQHPELDRRAINGCFAFSIALGTLLTVICALASGPVAAFYGREVLAPMIAVLGINFLIGSFSSVPNSMLRRAMRFRPLVQGSLLGVAVQSAVVLACAWKGLGVWSLVIAFVAQSLTQVIWTWVASGWRPTGGFDLKGARQLVGYGMTITYSRFLTFFYQNVDRVIVGRLLGERAVGFQEMAISIAALPVTQVTGLVTNVASPLLSRLQHEPKRVAAALFHLSRGIAYLTFPACAGMVITAPELIPLLLGSQWVDLTLPFQILTMTVLVRTTDPLLSQALISTGHAKRLVGYAILTSIVLPIAVTVGALTEGLVGVATAMMIVLPFLTLYLIHDCASLFQFTVSSYLLELARASQGTIFMAIVTLGARSAMLGLGLSSGAVLAGQVAAGVVSYLAWFCLGSTRTLAEARQLLLDLGIAERRLHVWPFTRIPSGPQNLV